MTVTLVYNSTRNTGRCFLSYKHIQTNVCVRWQALRTWSLHSQYKKDKQQQQPAAYTKENGKPTFKSNPNHYIQFYLSHIWQKYKLNTSSQCDLFTNIVNSKAFFFNQTAFYYIKAIFGGNFNICHPTICFPTAVNIHKVSQCMQDNVPTFTGRNRHVSSWEYFIIIKT